MFWLNSFLNLKCLYNKLVLSFIGKSRHCWKNMDCIDLHPPSSVNGMTLLDKSLFRKVIKIPQLKIPREKSNEILPLLKNYLLKMERIKPVFPNKDNTEEKIVLLHPKAYNWEILPKKELNDKNITEKCFQYGELELNYENWKADEILKAVLPKDSESLTSYSKIGHILHVNLRNHLLPYKTLIGEVLRDKIPGCRTVVNKSHSIDNTFRNFSLELLCGEENYITETKENGVKYQFDFSKVYWNPRLSTEHEKVVKNLKFGDIFYDVFAGVGPFSIPAAKRKCSVIANDLNPESYTWLKVNVKMNKCESNMEIFNMDGRDFIEKIVKTDLAKKLEESNHAKSRKIFITMNLPGKAVEFLDAFKGLLNDKPELESKQWCLPLVHVYCFIKGEANKDLVLNFVEDNAGYKIRDNLAEIHFVRNVAPSKDMYRVSFYLPKNILFEDVLIRKRRNLKPEHQPDQNKKICTNH
ncbi:tRNA (guanine(37)-N1)-methyltransferase [Condylostylus longicornis]|uniref:tRNA (guanine(37)-N1)-methyltransferase n=1 Tax=Condylostylus longicornis TaxID=2530218 RepID=UPI00244DC19F|nr:tRNA (guanine(37)-N1)-methyltransferase [Condylostylus longicornis]